MPGNLQGGAQQPAGLGGTPMPGVTPAATQMDPKMAKLARLNPYLAQMSPEEQKAAKTRMLLGMLQGGIGKQGMQYGLGALDSVVDEAYQRGEREKTREQAEREMQRREAEDKAQEERWARQEERLRAQEERMMKQAESAQQYQQRSQEMEAERLRLAQESAAAQRAQQQQQMKDRQRMAELTKKMHEGVLTPAEQIEYASLGGSPYAIDPSRRSANPLAGFGLGQGGMGGPTLSDYILAGGG